MKIYLLVGTRPNFIKITQFKRVAKRKRGMDISIIHTGQHYDRNMADVFFEQFNVTPDHYLEVPQVSPASQVAEIIVRLEKLFNEIERPDLLIVPGDVNSTLAGAVAANKLGIQLAHLESGLRSFDRAMPEEHNRVVADHLSDLLFVTEPSGLENLHDENVRGDIYFVGNTMIDTLVAFDEEINASTIMDQLKVQPDEYILTTMHRPSNVDDAASLRQIIDLFQAICQHRPMVFPIHPRTIKNFAKHNLEDSLRSIEGMVLTDPLGYFEFQKLVKHATAVLTDSGGIQEECTFRQVPCLTLRDNTERPVTITEGSNTLVSFDEAKILGFIEEIVNGEYKKGEVPELWDGQATIRILDVIGSTLG